MSAAAEGRDAVCADEDANPATMIPAASSSRVM
jgi:hypothetical protein